MNIKELLKKHENIKTKPYDDYDGITIGRFGKNTIVGKITIGVGRNLDDKGLSLDEIDYLLNNDIKDAEIDARAVISNFAFMAENRKTALICMAFNLGRTRLMKFSKMIKAIEKEDWKEAKKEMLDSLWAKQVKDRAIELADMMEKG